MLSFLLLLEEILHTVVPQILTKWKLYGWNTHTCMYTHRAMLAFRGPWIRLKAHVPLSSRVVTGIPWSPQSGLKGGRPPVEFEERPRDCSPGHAGKEGLHLARWGSDTTERLHFHFSLSCIGEGNGNPLQGSCLENPREGGAWWAAVSGVAQSRTRLKWLTLPYLTTFRSGWFTLWLPSPMRFFLL